MGERGYRIRYKFPSRAGKAKNFIMAIPIPAVYEAHLMSFFQIDTMRLPCDDE
jgi:hypothetical protein